MKKMFVVFLIVVFIFTGCVTPRIKTLTECCIEYKLHGTFPKEDSSHFLDKNKDKFISECKKVYLKDDYSKQKLKYSKQTAQDKVSSVYYPFAIVGGLVGAVGGSAIVYIDSNTLVGMGAFLVILMGGLGATIFGATGVALFAGEESKKLEKLKIEYSEIKEGVRP